MIHRDLLVLALLCVWVALLPARAVAQDPLPFIPANSASASDLAYQADGGVVVVGQAGGAVALARYTALGDLDAGFGARGRVLTPFERAAYGAAIVLQPDGKPVVAGQANGAVAVLRYLPNGRLDPTFGVGGIVKTRIGADSAAAALALQPDGALVVAGYADNDVALVRYKPNGSLDAGFGAGGKVITSFGARAVANALLRQPDGKLVIAGVADRDIALARYKADGSLDASFGMGGKVITDFGAGEAAVALRRQDDGKLIVAGRESLSLALVRYTALGQLDPSFGSGGHVVDDIFPTFYDAAFALVIRPDGRIVVAGEAAVLCMCNIPPSGIALAQFMPDGKLDAGFGDAGTVVTDLTANDDYLAAISLDPQGALVVAGGTGGYPGGYPPFAFVVGRYTPGGSVDGTFAGGLAITRFPLPDRAHLPVVRRP